MYLTGSGTSVFAVLHRGAGPPKQIAVLLCPLFGWEDMLTYGVRREWAEYLARGGFTTLRIDFPGSGDSAGDPTDPGQLEAWTQAVDGAARWLRQAEGARQVAIIGMGLAGLVSCRAALRGAPVDELILWSVPARGRTIVRELRAFSAFDVAHALEDRESAPDSDPGEDGTVLAGGYLLSAETAKELERVDLGEVELSSSTLRRALLLGRDGMKINKVLPGVLEQAGATVEVADGPGYGAMIPVEPADVRAPTEVFELVSSWLGEGESCRGKSVEAAKRVQPVTVPVARSAPENDDEIVLQCSGVAVRERPVLFDGPGGRLFGVLTEPVGVRSELTALLVNSGLLRRTGPNRMWVEIARRWAAKGVSTLRLDAAGIGDFEGAAKMPDQVRGFYNPLYVQHACATLDMLADRGLPPRFVVLGLCSGAYCAAHAALADERVAAVFMLNPVTLVFDEWEWRRARGSIDHLREQLLLPAAWGKVLKGDISLQTHLTTGREIVKRVVSTPARARKRIVVRRRADRTAGEPTVSDPIEGLFDALSNRGQRGLLMFAGKESLHTELRRKGVLDRMDRWPNLELAHLGASADKYTFATHMLTPLWLQRQVHELLDRVLEDELERSAGEREGMMLVA